MSEADAAAAIAAAQAARERAREAMRHAAEVAGVAHAEAAQADKANAEALAEIAQARKRAQLTAKQADGRIPNPNPHANRTLSLTCTKSAAVYMVIPAESKSMGAPG